MINNNNVFIVNSGSPTLWDGPFLFFDLGKGGAKS